MKNNLSLSNSWFVDGTFKLLPEIFHQFHTIHVVLNGFAPLCVYVRLPNKTEVTYNRLIELLKEETNPNPGKLLAHFYEAALNAFSKKFTHAEYSCCYFHLTQSFNRKIKEIGLKTSDENFPEFNLALRLLPALAHVPPAPVRTFFALVIEEKTGVTDREQFEESVVEKMDELAINFESTFIENLIVIENRLFQSKCGISTMQQERR